MSYKAIESIPGWYNVARKAGELYDTLEAYEKVPMVYRAINLRADALGTVPFKLERNGQYVDYPFATNMEYLLQQTEKALLLFGHAYWLRVMKGRLLTGFQFLQPQTMHVSFDDRKVINGDMTTGLVFTQRIGSKTFGPWTTAEVVYFREPNFRDDIHGGTAPAEVALQSARLAYYLERFASAFFEHGAQPALVMSLDKSITPPEYERVKSTWQRYAENVSNAFKTFFFRGDVNAQVISFPLKDMELISLSERTTTNIVTTFGVPRSMLEASAANYATADSDRQSFWRETVVPRLSLYERILNDAIFAPLKYHFEFHPDELEVMQTDEAARADSLVKLVQAGMSLEEAKYRLGYADVSAALGLPQTEGTEMPEEGEEQEQEELTELAMRRSKDLLAYQRKAVKRLKEKGSASVSFTSDSLPAYMLDYLSVELGASKKKSDVVGLFGSLKLSMADMTPEERELYRAIAKALESYTSDNIQAIANGQYDKVSTDLRNILTKRIADMVLKAGAAKVTPIVGLNDAQNKAMVDEALQSVSNTYMDSYWNPFLQDLSSTEKQFIDRVILQAQTTPGITTDDIREKLSMFGELRAQRIAFTEPTRAAAQQMNTLQGIAQSAGVLTVRVWNTINEGDICDECIELDGTDETMWGVQYPSGPPAHVNCRCVLGLKLVPKE